MDFGIFSIGLVMTENETIAHQIGEIHEMAAYALVGVARLHALVAPWHHFVRKDDVLRRILPPHLSLGERDRWELNGNGNRNAP